MSGLIWIQTVLHSDRMTEIFFFEKVGFEKNQQRPKSRKKSQGGELTVTEHEQLFNGAWCGPVCTNTS